MEIRQNVRSLPSRPIALALAALAVLALLLTAWFVLSGGSQVRGNANYRVQAPATHAASCGDPYSPRDPVCGPVQDPYSPHDRH